MKIDPGSAKSKSCLVQEEVPKKCFYSFHEGHFLRGMTILYSRCRQKDRTLIYGTLGNYSLAGFEMILHRYVSHYIITYYLPSGESI